MMENEEKLSSSTRYEDDQLNLWAAAADDNYQLIKIIHSTLEERYKNDAEDEQGHTPLWVAAALGCCAAVKQLAEFGADVNRPGGQAGTTPLGIATQNGDVGMILCLKQLNVDMNKGDYLGFTPLHIAAQENYEDIVRLLVKLGGDIDKQNNCGATPLFMAAYMGHCNMIKVLYELGCEYKLTHDGTSPLWQAAILHHDEAVSILRDLGAPVQVPEIE